jgi:hypothetical protein
MDNEKKLDISSEEKAFIEKMYFSHGEKLSQDYVNAYSALYSNINSEKPNLDNLKHIETYEEYFQDKQSGSLIESLSDKNTVESLNSLVNNFNKEIDREKINLESVKELLEGIHNLVIGK